MKSKKFKMILAYLKVFKVLILNVYQKYINSYICTWQFVPESLCLPFSVPLQLLYVNYFFLIGPPVLQLKRQHRAKTQFCMSGQGCTSVFENALFRSSVSVFGLYG